MKNIVPTIFFCAVLLAVLPQTAKAENFDSSGYSIEGEILPGAVTPTPEISQMDQNSPSDSSNYVVRSGYGEKTSPFSLQTSQNMIEYESLTPTDAITRTTIVSIHSGPHYGYTLFLSEDHPLQAGKNLIPDTTCDNGSCSEDIPAPWTSALTYGLGYRCDDETGSVPIKSGSGCQTRFQDETEFLQIPKKPQEVMKNIVGGFDRSEMTFKLNISGAQPSAVYTNQVTYIALPTL